MGHCGWTSFLGKVLMQLLSPTSSASLCSSSTKASFPIFSPSQNHNNNKNNNNRFCFKLVPTTGTLTLPRSSNQQSPILNQRSLSSESSRPSQLDKDNDDNIHAEEVLVFRRPPVDVSGEGDSNSIGDEDKSSSAIIDAGPEDFAKKMPICKPMRVDTAGSSQEKQQSPLLANLDLALYKAKLLARTCRYQQAEDILQKCISYWPEDGRPYVTLGKILSKQSKFAEARAVFEKGCQATRGENPYIWQCWAVLENKMGNVRRARELFDAAIVADKRHVGAWHGRAVLELKQGNVNKARQLLVEGLKFCRGNEYAYQTLALLEIRAKHYDQARQLFGQAVQYNPKSCASWLAWAQLEVWQENNMAARQLFEKAVQASPKNRFAWNEWGTFEAHVGNIDKARKLLKIGHVLNPRNPALLQSLAILEYKHSTANLARALFRKASTLDPRHQPVWIAWGWVEWKEGNISTARELYRKALSIDSTSKSAARCLQAWGVLEHRVGNLSAARRLFRSSLNVNSQRRVTWMAWAQLEEDQGNFMRAEEIRDLYFQQHTELVDDASWVSGSLDIIDPTLDSIDRLLNLDQDPTYMRAQESVRNNSGANVSNIDDKLVGLSSSDYNGNATEGRSEFDVDSFVKERLSLDPTKIDVQLELKGSPARRRARLPRRIWRSSERRNASTFPKSGV